jgi:uncharacterized membrane protein (UPF0136 family)
MKTTALLKIGSALLILWGLLNSVGGILGALDHPSPLVLPLFGTVGTLIVVAGICLWLNKNWAVPLAAVALVGLSLTALHSASVLRGWSEMNITHHITRLIISGAILVTAILGRRRVASRKQEQAM